MKTNNTDSQIEALLDTTPSAKAIAEAQANIAKSAHDNKVRAYQGAIQRAENEIATAVTSLRSLRQQEKDAKARLTALVTGRDAFVTTGKGKVFAEAVYPGNPRQSQEYLTYTLGLTE